MLYFAFNVSWQNLTVRHINTSFGLPTPSQTIRDLCFWCLSRLIKTLSFARYECKLINLWKFQLNLVAGILPVTQNNFFILITHLFENVLAFWRESTNPSLLGVKEWKRFILVISLNLWATVCITKTCYLHHIQQKLCSNILTLSWPPSSLCLSIKGLCVLPLKATNGQKTI